MYGLPTDESLKLGFVLVYRRIICTSFGTHTTQTVWCVCETYIKEIRFFRERVDVNSLFGIYFGEDKMTGCCRCWGASATPSAPPSGWSVSASAASAASAASSATRKLQPSGPRVEAARDGQGAKPRSKSGQFFAIMCDIDSGAASRRDARA